MLNNISLTAANIWNEYLQAQSSERHYIMCGIELRLQYVGKVALIRNALYGGKVIKRDFWFHLCYCIDFLGFHSCKADHDVWMCKDLKPNGNK